MPVRGPAGIGWKMLAIARAGGRVGREGAGPQDCPTPGNIIHKEGMVACGVG